MDATLTKALLIAVGGALGALSRYALSGAAYGWFGETFPWGTAAVNLLGCFLIGLLWALFERGPFHAGLNAFVFVGVLGGFTTFSTYGLETLNLLRDGEVVHALTNVLVNNLLGLFLVGAGFVAGRGLATITMGGPS